MLPVSLCQLWSRTLPVTHPGLNPGLQQAVELNLKLPQKKPKWWTSFICTILNTLVLCNCKTYSFSCELSLFNKLFCKQCFILVMKKLTKVASLKSKLLEQIKSQGVVVTEPYQVLNPVKWRIYKVFEANSPQICSKCWHGNKVYSDHCQVKSHTTIVSDCDCLLLSLSLLFLFSFFLLSFFPGVGWSDCR